ncbi:MAG: PIN domain-containing protein [Mariprofundaceae bacterium]
MLDTNICIYLIKRKPAWVRDRFIHLEPGDVLLSSIVLAELMHGVERSASREQNRAALEMFLMPLDIVPFDDAAAARYGEIRACLEAKGCVIGGNDLFIAAHALSLGVTLVTNNEREFARVPGLRLENWARDD